MTNVLGRDSHILTYPVILNWSDFKNNMGSDLTDYFMETLPLEDFLDIVVKIILNQTSRGNASVYEIPRDNVLFNGCVNKLFEVVSKMLSSITSRNDIILHVKRDGVFVVLVVGEIENKLTLAEFRYFLDMKENEGYYIPTEINKLLDEFSSVGQAVIFDSFK